MIVAGQLLLTDEENAARLEPGYVRLDGEHISEVVLGEAPAAADFGGPECLVLPGLIDAHAHFPQFEMIGAHGLGLLDWLEGVTFPTERKWEDTAYAEAAAGSAIDQFFSHGTTGVCAYATVHHEGAMASLRVANDRGMRGLIGQTLMNRNAPDYLLREAQQQIDETSHLLEAFPEGSRAAGAVTPRFAVSCTADLLEAAGRLAAERGACVQTHLAETKNECALIAELFDGVPYTQVYRDAGLLTDRAVLGHGIYLSEVECQMLCETRAVVAHCPTANSFLRSGTMNRGGLLKCGVRLALGSDVGAGYERSMVRAARAMIEAAATLDGPIPSAAEAWWHITAGNAQVLGWDAGVLREKSPADVVLVQPDIEWLSGPVDPLSRLMFSWDDRWIRRTWAQGRAVFGSGG